MARAVLVLGLLTSLMAACSARSAGPAWPKQTFPDDDGGESLAPRDAITTALEDEEDDAVEVKPDKTEKPAKDQPDKADKPAETTAETPKGTTPVVPEDVITTEDIVIEIEED
jgi:hypothetical protein